MHRSTMPLLMQGNGKLGNAIHVWSIPALDTCPGSSSICRTACYALRHRFRFAQVKERLDWNWRQSGRSDFIDRMTAEIRARGVLVLRLHVAGDFADVAYAEKWLAVVKQSPRVRFYAYTRSWRLPSIAAVLEKMAALRAMRLWYSIDDETGVPPTVPAGTRLAFLQVREDQIPAESDLVFRVQGLRKLSSLPIVCDQETVEGKALKVTCGSCARCFR